MIRRALAFVLLLALGFLALRLALGGEAFSARHGMADDESLAGGRQRPPPVGGIDVQPKKAGDAALTLSIEGEFEVRPSREVALPDGSKLLLPKYRLHANDTRPRPEANNLMELRDVTVELFRLVRQGAEPRAEQAGELRATMVLVEIERDGRGRPTIHEDREMDFHDAVFRTLPGASSTPLTLRVARARLRSTDQGAVLRTAEREPFTLQMAGDQPATLTGLGLHATMPTGDAVAPIEVRVLAEPRLATDDGRTTLASRGSLEFIEQPDQTGRLTLHDTVTASFVQTPGGPPLTARGDQLVAGLRRTGKTGGGKQGALWQWLVLRGAPAQIDAGQARLDCERVDLLPSASGSAGLLAATGATPRLTLTPVQGKPSVFTSERRICMLPLGDSLHEWIGPLGFPRSAFAAHFAQMITFAGRANVEAEQATGHLTLFASAGLVVLRGDKEGGATSLRGLGDVAAKLPGDDATLAGDDGLLLHDMPTATGRVALLTLGVGGKPSPRFELQRGEQIRLTGHGQCRLQDSTADKAHTARITVASPTADAVVVVPEGSLLDVGTLEATLLDGAITQLDAKGTPCVFEGQTRDGIVRGEAATVHSEDGRTFRLLGAPAHVVRGQQGEVFGSVIDLIRAGDRTGLRARGTARIAARFLRKDGKPLDLNLRGDLAELLPWRVPPAALSLQASYLPPSAAVVFAASWLTTHVHVRDAVSFTFDDPSDPAAKNSGDGDELWLALQDTGGRGRLLGHPAHARVAAAGQDALGGAETISFLLADDKPLVTLSPTTPSESTLHLAAAGDQVAGGSKVGVREFTVYCRGPIRVESQQIRFLGSVRVLGDEIPGQPVSLALFADGMVMQRDAKGAVTDIVASGRVTLASPRLYGTADTLTLDLRQGIAVLSSPLRHGLASITLDRGLCFQNSYLEFDYTTYAVAAWYGEVEPRGAR